MSFHEQSADVYHKRLLEELRKLIDDKDVDNWFGQYKIQIYQDTATLTFPTNFIRDWVATYYLDQLKTCISQLTDQCSKILLEIDTEQGTHTRSGLTFENFIISGSNKMAYTAAYQVSRNIQQSYNPLVIYGEPGVGKSHLLSAIAHHVRARQLVHHMTAEEFMYQFIQSLKKDSIDQFRTALRSANLLLIDDVQFMMGKDSTQEEFFHTFNSLTNNGCQIVLSCDQHPYSLEGLAKRLRSRLGSGLIVEIHQPDYELKLGFLMHKKDLVSYEVKEFVADTITGSIRDLEGAWSKLLTHSDWSKCDITIEFAKQVLHEVVRTESGQLDYQAILTRVCRYYNIDLADLTSGKRHKQLTKARHICMYLLKDVLALSFSEIGRLFGGRDHTSIMYAVNKLKQDHALQHESQQILEH